MKTVLRWAIGSACILVLGGSALMAQQFAPGGAAAAPAAAPARQSPFPGGIALIDVSVIFDKHNRFQAQMEAMKNEVKAFEVVLRQKQEAINAEAEKAKQFQPGSPQYKEIEERVARMTNDLKLETGFKRKEFLEREAEAYFQVYREIESVVGQYATRYGLSLVLRYGSQEINSKDRESVLRGINRPVVFRQPYLDITGPILAQLNLGTSPPAATPPAGQVNGPSGQPNFGPAGTNPNAGRVFVPGATQPR